MSRNGLFCGAAERREILLKLVDNGDQVIRLVPRIGSLVSLDPAAFRR